MKTLLSNHTIRQILGVFILLVSLTSIGCTDNITPTLPSLKIKADTLLFTADGGTQDILFTTNRDWFLEKIDNVDWLEISAGSGSAENGFFSITVDPSSVDDNARVAKLQLRASAVGVVITVIQSGIPIVTTGDVRMKDETTALIAANWIYAVNINLAERGIAYSADGNTYTHVHSGDIERGDYQTLLEGLTEEKEYQYKAYIKTNDGTYYYGAVKSFTTDPKSELISISELRGTSGSTINRYVKIEGIVLNDTVIKNYVSSNTCLQIVDRANPDKPNQGITLRLSSNAVAYNMGDVVEVKLNAATIGLISGLPTKVITVEPLKVKKIGTAAVTPVKIDHTRMKDYESMYVEVEKSQLVKAYLSSSLYPTWNGENHPNVNTTYIMEVDGSEDTYGLFVNKVASFANDAVKTGSGTTKGVVGYASGVLISIWPNSANDVSTLTGTRFQTMLALKFTSTTFTGDLVINSVADSKCVVSVFYQNAEEGDVIAGPVSVELSGDGADGLYITPQENIALATGLQSLSFQVRGTPTTVGEITFTVKGLEGYELTGSKAIATGWVTSGIPEGNFKATWVPLSSDNTNKGASPPLALTSNNASSVVLSSVTGTGFTNGASYASCWGGAGFNTNGVGNPTVFAEFTVTPGANTLSIYSISLALRKDGDGYKLCTIQYKIGGGSFTTVATIEETGSSNNTLTEPKNLSMVSELQNIPAGTIVTFRLIPTGSINSAGRWGINGTGSNNSGLFITGNVQ